LFCSAMNFALRFTKPCKYLSVELKCICLNS